MNLPIKIPHCKHKGHNIQPIVSGCSFDNGHEKVEKYDTYDVVTQLVVSELRSHDLYVLLYRSIANIIVTGIIPILLLSYFNFFIFKGMKKFVQKRPFWSKQDRISSVIHIIYLEIPQYNNFICCVILYFECKIELQFIKCIFIR